MSKASSERTEIREMPIETALHELALARRQMFDLRMQGARGEVKNVRQFAETRKRIARLLHKIHTETQVPLESEFLEAPEDELELPAPTSPVAALEAPDEDEAEDDEETEEPTQ